MILVVLLVNSKFKEDREMKARRIQRLFKTCFEEENSIRVFF